MDIIFFHGLHFESKAYDQAYWKSWMSLSKSELQLQGDPNEAEELPVCWPEKWLGPEFGARILSIKYDSSITQTPTTGRMTMQNLGENLIQDILRTKLVPMVGKQSVFLVGHSLGCLVIKQLLLHSQGCVDASKRMIENMKLPNGHAEVRKYETIKSFLDSVKGLCFYSPPLQGTRLADFVQTKGKYNVSPTFEFLKTLSTEGALLNDRFRVWRSSSVSPLRVNTIAESLPTMQWGYNEVVVCEAACRTDTDKMYTAAADHFTVIRPISPMSSLYQDLTNFIEEQSGVHRMQAQEQMEREQMLQELL